MADSNDQSKDIYVVVGEQVKRVDNVSALLTILSDGGTTKWIPVSNFKTIRKVINKPGEYSVAKEPGHPNAYSEVVVTNGDGDGVYKVGIKAITENGVYKAYEENGYPFYAYSTVIVNVPGG